MRRDQAAITHSASSVPAGEFQYHIRNILKHNNLRKSSLWVFARGASLAAFFWQMAEVEMHRRIEGNGALT